MRYIDTDHHLGLIAAALWQVCHFQQRRATEVPESYQSICLGTKNAKKDILFPQKMRIGDDLISEDM
jgi:hypothetical protein